jgi:hypothetical protein
MLAGYLRIDGQKQSIPNIVMSLYLLEGQESYHGSLDKLGRKSEGYILFSWKQNKNMLKPWLIRALE